MHSKALHDGQVYLDRLLPVRLLEIVVIGVGGHTELTHIGNKPNENASNEQ